MTPAVLSKATEENPFDMTTFVVNPNIYQDAMDENENPINSRINGWVCETNADGTHRTEHKSGDSWLVCYSWSGHEGHNIASATNYRQVVGTQIGEEGKFALPVGTYRVEAATWITGGPDLMWFYAQTNDVEISTMPDITPSYSGYTVHVCAPATERVRSRVIRAKVLFIILMSVYIFDKCCHGASAVTYGILFLGSGFGKGFVPAFGTEYRVVTEASAACGLRCYLSFDFACEYIGAISFDKCDYSTETRLAVAYTAEVFQQQRRVGS